MSLNPRGDWKVYCDYSGFPALASQCVMTWDGKFVLRRFWTDRPPSEITRPVSDNQSVPVVRHAPREVEITPQDINIRTL